MKIKFSLISAALLWLAWPMNSFTAILFIAFIPLLFLEDELHKSNNPKSGRQLFTYTFLCFAIWNLACSYWIYNAAGVGLVIAVFLNAFLMSLPFWFYHKLRSFIPKQIAFIGFCAAWISIEYFHMQWDLSWPWFTLGNGFSTQIKWVQWYEYTGVFGGSIWILAVNGLIYFSFEKFYQNKINSLKNNFKILLNPILLIIIPIIFSLFLYTNYVEKINPCKIVVVQPNIDPYHDKFSGMTTDEQLNVLIRLSDSLGKKDTEFFIWPETAISTSIEETHFEENISIIKIRNFLTKYKNATLITGADTYLQYTNEETETARKFNNGQCCYDVFNTALLIENGTAIQTYHKSKLVAGVEQMPYPKIFKFLEPLAINLGGTFGSLGKEKEAKVLYTRSGIGAAPIICYESIYGEYCNEYIKKGAQFLAIITNDGWWGNTPGFKQHNSYACLRAIETRRSIARSANTGLSSFINQKGEIEQVSTWWTPLALTQEINLNDEITFYTKHGDWIAKIFISIFSLAVLLLILKRFHIIK